jgi:hypothetical protein
VNLKVKEMVDMIRSSPVVFEAKAAKTETRDNWTVVLEYEGEENGPYLIDLSHKARWDIQDAEIAGIRPWGIKIPDTPGRSVFEKGVLINRMNRTQASVWHLVGDKPASPAERAFTDVTDATLFLALLGKGIFAITEKLSSLDFLDPSKDAPFLLQGPFSHVPCQIVTLQKTTSGAGILLTCSRGYAQDMIASILESGAESGIQPAGENMFNKWIDDL